MKACEEHLAHLDRLAGELQPQSHTAEVIRSASTTSVLPDPTGWTREQAFPGALDQAGHVRAAVSCVLEGYPVKDEVILIPSGLFFPGLESFSQRVHPRSLSYLPAGSSCRQGRLSSWWISVQGRRRIQAAGRK